MNSTMMLIVHTAMNKAHEKMKTKGGVLERLNGISRFYELAAMQLEGCLKFVREETSYILESSDEQVLSDLTEIRDRLHLRLKESEKAIKDKDRELASLQANVTKLAGTKSDHDPLEEHMVSNQVIELRHAVDQQVWHIRQQLEPKYKCQGKEGDAQVPEGLNNQKIEHLDSDIGVLKETLDLAFQKMQKAVFGSGVGPIEQQLLGEVERDTMSVLLQGFMRDFQENVEEQVWNKKHEKQVCFGLKEYWSDLMNEVDKLRRGLQPLVAENEVPKCPTSYEKSSADDSDHEKQQFSMQEQHEENKEEGGNFVSKMIKNHESIIRKKSAEAEELNILRREILRHKAHLSTRRDEDTFVKKRMQEVVVRLDNMRHWDAKLQETFANYDSYFHGQNTPSDKRSPRSYATICENLELDTMSEIWEKMDRVHYGGNGELQNEERMVKQEQDGSNLEDDIMKVIYVTILEGLVKEKCNELYDNKLENQLRGDIYQVLFTEVMNQWNENIESDNTEAQTREEFYDIMHCTVLSEGLKDYRSITNFVLAESSNLRAENNLEAAIREDIWFILLREMAKECRKMNAEYEAACLIREEIDQLVFHETIKDIAESSYNLVQHQDIVARKECTKWKADYETACCLREEISQLVFHETIKDIVQSASYHFSQHQEIIARNFLQTAENSVKEDIYMVFIRETIKEWNMKLSAFDMESLIREEIYHFVIVEMVKDAFVLLSEEADFGNQEKFSESMLFANKLHNSNQVSTSEENVKDKLGSPLSCLEVVEDMMQSESFEINGCNVELDFVSLEGDSKQGYQVPSEVGSVHYEKLTNCPLKANENVNPSDCILTPLIQFSEELVKFQHTTNEKLEMSFLRMDSMKHQVDKLAILSSSLRKTGSLYREAFRRRCQDLWKAETEVDLLGDQVDVLQGLLEKIYTILYPHLSVLEQYFEVSDVLELIKKELVGVIDASKD